MFLAKVLFLDLQRLPPFNIMEQSINRLGATRRLKIDIS